MSRVGRKPVPIVSGVKVEQKGRDVNVQGPKGKLSLKIHPRIKVEVKDNKEVVVTRPTDIRTDRALHGLTRNLINNMIIGVTQGFTKELEIVGVGYKAQVKGKVLNLNLGYTHDIEFHIPQGVEVKCPNPTRVVLTGIDKQAVGEAAAVIRRYHPPEPYKGKGILFVGEQIRRKQGKAVG